MVTEVGLQGVNQGFYAALPVCHEPNYCAVHGFASCWPTDQLIAYFDLFLAFYCV